MLKAILADDEPFIRQGLKKLIDWGKCGYEVIAEAGDGLEAFEFIKKFQPDLVIADIKMPGMDGIELLEKVRGIFGDKIKFVILSGYYEFEYAKRAIRGKAAEYILKPVNKEEFSAVLEKIRLECDALEEQKKMQIQKEKF
ncbi:MAG: two-component system, response regulator YesN, partial [Clostridiales bacterium]|nr:two-component system, response regulator YesN [Clostridiales bacterium]